MLRFIDIVHLLILRRLILTHAVTRGVSVPVCLVR